MSTGKISLSRSVRKCGSYVVLLFLFLAAVTAGCSPASGKGGDATQDATKNQNQGSGEKITLRFMTWDSGETLKPYQNAIDEFMKRNPDIVVKTESVPDNFDQKLLTSLASKTAPDVFMAWNYPKYVPSGALGPLDEYIRKDGVNLGDYYDIIVSYMKYEGKIWGLPTTYSPRAIYYNKQLFDEAQVPYPKDGWTWDEFLETVKKLTKPGQYGFISTPDDFFTMQVYFWSNGGDIISDDGKKIDGVFNSSQNIETIKFLKQLYDVSAKVSSAGKFSTSNGLEVFKTGKIAMYDDGMWPLNGMLKEGKLKLGTVTHPVPKDGTLKGMIHASGYSMPKDGKNKEAAWKLIKFLSGPEGSKIITQNKFSFSPVKAVDQEHNYAADPYLKPFTEELKNADKTLAFMRNENWDKASDILKLAIQQILVNNADIRSTVDKAAKEAEAVLKK